MPVLYATVYGDTPPVIVTAIVLEEPVHIGVAPVVAILADIGEQVPVDTFTLPEAVLLKYVLFFISADEAVLP